jgi:hypothetical protein
LPMTNAPMVGTFGCCARTPSSSPDMDCHATLPWGSCPCNGRTISRFDPEVCGYFMRPAAGPLTLQDSP